MEMEVYSESDSMEDVIVEPMSRRIKGRGRLRSQTKTLGHPKTTAATAPFFHDVNDLHSQAYAPQRSIEGWIILITGIHEESQEDHIFNLFREYGEIKNLHLNLDRRTGFVKGYALIEYKNFDEAEAAILGRNGAKLFGHPIFVGRAFSTGPVGSNFRSQRLNRSRSPRRNY